MAINHGSLSARLTPKKTLKGTVQAATIAYESDYERLTNKPSINNIEVIGDLSLDDLGIVNNVQPDWEQDDTEAEDYIKNKPEIPDAQIQSDWEQTDEEAKDYIKNKPTIPPEQVNSDWNAVSGKAQILNKPTIPSVVANPGNTTENLTSIGINGTNYAIQGGGGGGAVNDVKVNETSVVDSQGVANIDLTGYATTSDIPTDLADLNDDSTHRLVTDTEKAGWDAKADTSDIPTVNNSTIIIQKNGQNVDTFTLNQNADKTIDISVPTKTSDLQNDSSFITNTVSNLANYYLKSETYTKTEVSNLIDAAVNGRFEKVQTLPVTGEANVIYLVPKTTALTNNVYDEYIWQDNAWEQLGSTEIDLSGYVTDTDLTTALADYVTTSAFNTAIANYYTKTEVGNLLDGKVDKVSGKGLSTNDYDNTAKSIVDGVTAALADKVDKIAGKGLSTNDYTDTDKAIVDGVTSALANKADKTAISSVETTNTAVAAHAVGSYFINASGQFVKTTSAIAIGDTIKIKPTVGYNCEATSIAGVLDDLNSMDALLTSRTSRNITTDLANLLQAVSEQNLEKYGYKIGDYFVGTSQGSNNFTYWLADMDTFYGGYDYYTMVGTHHICLVVDTKTDTPWYTGSAALNYGNSDLHTYLSNTALNIIKADMIALFGGTTGLEHLLKRSITYSKIGSWDWSDSNEQTQYITALTESQVAGSPLWSADKYQQGEGHKQLKLFSKYSFSQLFGKIWFWLRSISTSALACRGTSAGRMHNEDITLSGRAVGLILLH